MDEDISLSFGAMYSFLSNNSASAGGLDRRQFVVSQENIVKGLRNFYETSIEWACNTERT